MKLLLQAALRNSRHLTLAILTFFTLMFAVVATQCEMFSLGLITSSGADFFALFSTEGKKIKDKISLEDVHRRWETIDTNYDGVISKQEAARYIASRKDVNPLGWVMHKAALYFDYEKNFSFLVLILMSVAFFKAITLFSSRYVTQLLSIRVTRDLRQQYFEHIQSLPLSFYQGHNLGSLSSRAVGDAGQIASSLNSCLTNYLQTPFTICSTLAACFYLSWKLSLIIFLGLPLIILPVIFLTRRVKRITRQIQKNQETFTSVLLDFLAGIQTVKIFAMEAFSLRKYKEQNDQMAHLESKSAKYGLLTRPVLHFIATGCLAIIVLFGLYSLHMTVGQLLMFCGLLHLFYEPVKKFAEENANIQKGVVAAERMFEVLHLRPQIEDRNGAIEITDFKNIIEFDRVWFKYREEWVIRDVSFTVKRGEIVALVGATGAGKSTLVQLIPRLYEVQKGEIRIDGIPLHAVTQKSLREQIAFVPQRPFLFFDTVAENIAFGRAFSQEEIEGAAKKAYADEFINELPNQYHTLLAEMGKTLSGGQQQRLAIARALVKKAPILIMDEATSSLDAISEQRIKKAMEDLRGELTQILIAHRLSTIEHADKIIYLEKGKKIAEGGLQELLDICLPFRLLWETYHNSESQGEIYIDKGTKNRL
ncbi:MAG: ABC transporter ATP-binding protein [Chlamydiae bacterium RIFCSPHIGHO2_12_FULL_44_59]|nr:MAG: ABC transporter ATP-binding protein [Chlamydiae bacterium RIFCSPHIGHO2_01_FULL_44_39]OGN59267.1 MAG: ABC transporter ATP-binding protein [Chlamydiae bacterium RIFCSPHIGHO2_02_FULL_45_9]OGN60198.1 MAG: ABC transporter ATP-binding protein [Chlamydiae bacterium RIFCSPHIGHO2_12_FULL_44_59]OGN67149.1 MAG: ABC transporter ATP-binding protein [Chlamydiae bacterium RIFCSPLOWO2_01_FULL_44_52]OGN67739.1 MAG: ABC transporter ATP-binding protein [Chlamydiae bacterium RIFCSPLOWO2_02_FULL_45_22]OGN7